MEDLKPKVMLVDDSDNLRHVIKDFLEMNGYVVLDYRDAESATKSYNTGMFDLCIFDLSARGNDNFSLLQNIRRYDKHIPIILLSEISNKENRIKGFRLGCDDFISKPFSIEELELRMQAIMRRSKYLHPLHHSLYEEKVYKLGNFTFDFSGMQLIHPKMTRTLTRKEAELLKLLVEHKNKLIPREIILKEIWGDEDHAVGRSMDVFLTKLRSYLQIDDAEHIAPKVKGKRKVAYKDEYEPLVEICNVHGTGFMIKIKE